MTATRESDPSAEPADGTQAAVRQLWEQWRQQSCPDFDDLVAARGPLTPDQVLAVLRCDQHERWRHGERIPAETYVHKYRLLREDPDAGLLLAYSEFALRQELGETATLQEYLERFPQHAEGLRQQYELDRALSAAAPGSPTMRAPPSSAHIAQPAVQGQADSSWPVITGYEILGRGGMGVVYKARQRALNRLVALKMIGAHADREQHRRFRAEAEVIARLHHPNFVQVYDYALGDSQPYLALEFVEGGTLAQKAAGVPQPPHRAAQIVETLAAAVHHAHREGLVHRDLKPANVLLTAEGVLKIADFGLAKRLEAVTAQTASGMLLGTPTYMAPEQVASERGTVGPATDVYALGVILYELLTGRTPFQGDSVLELLRQVQEQEPLPPGRLQPGTPRDLETICLKCLEKESSRRYPSAQALADDLRRFQAGEPIAARPVGRLERAWRWCKRKPALATLTASLATALVVIALGSLFVAVRAKQTERDITEKLRQSYLQQAQAGRLSPHMGHRLENLGVLKKAAAIRPDPELRNEAIACFALADLRLTLGWQGPTKYGAAFDAALARYAYGADDKTVLVRRVEDGHILASLLRPAGAVQEGESEFSPDGRFLANLFVTTGNNARFLVWDLDRGGTVLDEAQVGCASFSADSRWIALGQGDKTAGRIAIHDLADQQPTKILEQSVRPTDLTFHPQGKQLAVLHADSVQILERDTGRILRTLAHPDEVSTLAWRGDGAMLAVACSDRRIYVWDMAEHQPPAGTQPDPVVTGPVGIEEKPARWPLSRLEGHQSGIVRLAFSHRGDLLASHSWDGTTRLWDPLSGRQFVSAPGAFLRFRHDDSQIAFVHDAQMGIWEIVRDGYHAFHHGRPVWGLDFSADGRLLAAAGDDGVWLWDLVRKEKLTAVTGELSKSALFAQQGTALLTTGKGGLRRWPIQIGDAAGRKSLSLGSPEILELPIRDLSNSRACFSKEGQLIAVADRRHGRAILWRGDRLAEPVTFGPHPGAHYVAFHPKSGWLATGTWRGDSVKVWDTTTGREIQELPIGQDTQVAFSPDGQWLVTGGAGKYQFWRVGSWQEDLDLSINRESPSGLPGPMAFAPDGRLLALARSTLEVQLFHADTGRQIARLPSPSPQIISYLCFSPDGSQLAIATEAGTVELWDLRRIRQGLAELGLDWDLPPYPPAVPADDTGPLTVIVDDGNTGKKNTK